MNICAVESFDRSFFLGLLEEWEGEEGKRVREGSKGRAFHLLTVRKGRAGGLKGRGGRSLVGAVRAPRVLVHPPREEEPTTLPCSCGQIPLLPTPVVSSP